MVGRGADGLKCYIICILETGDPLFLIAKTKKKKLFNLIDHIDHKIFKKKLYVKKLNMTGKILLTHNCLNFRDQLRQSGKWKICNSMKSRWKWKFT